MPLKVKVMIQAGEQRDGYFWTPQKCPICDVRPTKTVGFRGGRAHREGLGVETEIKACGKCSLIFPDPMPFPVGGLGQHYSMDAEEYFALHDEDQRLEGSSVLVNEAEKLLGRKGKMLDVGVGRGEVMLSAIRLGWDCEGVEPSTTFADYVEKRTEAKIWRHPIEECDIPAGEFDVVILSAVLEHLYDPNAVIEKIASFLKKGGLLYLDVPNEKGLFFQVGNAYQKLRGRDWCVNLAPTFSPFHVFGFSPRSLKMLLSKHGMRLKTINVYGGTSHVSSRGGVAGSVESLASKAVTTLSNVGNMGTYIQAWAVKD